MNTTVTNSPEGPVHTGFKVWVNRIGKNINAGVSTVGRVKGGPKKYKNVSGPSLSLDKLNEAASAKTPDEANSILMSGFEK